MLIFTKFFCGKLGDFVVRALSEAYNVNSLSETQTQGLITCIPKGNKPKEYLKNWPPITLLNTEQDVLQTELNNFFLNLSTQTSPDLLKTDTSEKIYD